MSGMVCTVCNDNITDKAMKAGDKLYHEEHFTCAECGTSLADPSVATYTKNDSLYCQQDYMKKFVPVCAKCDQYITQVNLSSYPLWRQIIVDRNVSKPWTRPGIRSISSVLAAPLSSVAV